MAGRARGRLPRGARRRRRGARAGDRHGRIALPLAQRGVPVHGIDLSPEMVAKLREKPGGGAIGVTIGDFATTRVEGTFALAYVVFNTIVNLTTQEAQVACFENVAAHLEPGGCFVDRGRRPGCRGSAWGASFDVATATSASTSTRRRPAARLPSLHAGRRRLGAELDSVPLGLAGRARPDGANRRGCGCATLGRLGARAVHGGEREARLRLGEGVSVELRVVESDADVEAWLQVRRVVLPTSRRGRFEQSRALRDGQGAARAACGARRRLRLHRRPPSAGSWQYTWCGCVPIAQARRRNGARRGGRGRSAAPGQGRADRQGRRPRRRRLARLGRQLRVRGDAGRTSSCCGRSSRAPARSLRGSPQGQSICAAPTRSRPSGPRCACDTPMQAETFGAGEGSSNATRSRSSRSPGLESSAARRSRRHGCRTGRARPDRRLRSDGGRGLATKLKRAQLEWAAANGYRELVTFTHRECPDATRERAARVRLGLSSPSPCSRTPGSLRRPCSPGRRSRRHGA